MWFAAWSPLSASDLSDHGIWRFAVEAIIAVAELDALQQARFTPMVDAIPATMKQGGDFVNGQPALFSQAKPAALQVMAPLEMVHYLESKRTAAAGTPPALHGCP